MTEGTNRRQPQVKITKGRGKNSGLTTLSITSGAGSGNYSDVFGALLTESERHKKNDHQFLAKMCHELAMAVYAASEAM